MDDERSIFKMSSAMFFRQRALRYSPVFVRNFCSKGDEVDLSVNFKYPTSKIIRDERRKSWKNHRNEDPKASFGRPTYSRPDREIQNWKTYDSNDRVYNDSNRIEKTVDSDLNLKSKTNERYEKVNNAIVSQDLMDAGGRPANKKRTGPLDVSSNYVRERRESSSGNRPQLLGEILFGINPVAMALKGKRRSFHRLFVKKNSAENPRIVAIKDLAKSLNVPVVSVRSDVLSELSDFRPHQGVCLDAGMLYFELDEREWDSSSYAEEEPLWIFMDKIQDPMNLGAVLRSCYYFGVNRVFTVKNQTCKLTPVVSKASSGAMEMIKVHAIENPGQFLNKNIKKGWNIIGTASRDALDREKWDPCKIVNLNDFSWPKQTILLIGNEGGGIDNELMRFCDRFVTISNGSPNMMSLNVSVATGIILHHCCTQLLPNAAESHIEENISA